MDKNNSSSDNGQLLNVDQIQENREESDNSDDGREQYILSNLSSKEQESHRNY